MSLSTDKIEKNVYKYWKAAKEAFSKASPSDGPLAVADTGLGRVVTKSETLLADDDVDACNGSGNNEDEKTEEDENEDEDEEDDEDGENDANTESERDEDGDDDIRVDSDEELVDDETLRAILSSVPSPTPGESSALPASAAPSSRVSRGASGSSRNTVNTSRNTRAGTKRR